MIHSFQDKLKSQQLQSLRYLTVFAALVVTALGFLFEFLYHDGWILFTGLILSMGLTVNFLLSHYNNAVRKYFHNINDITIALLHVWAVFVAYQRDFEIMVLLPVSISIFTFSLVFDRVIKSVVFIFLLTTLMLALMLVKRGWEPQYTVAIITLYSGALLSDQIQKRKKQFHREIENQENRFAALVENMNDGLIYADSEWRIVSVSEQFSRITGYAASGLVGKDIRLFSNDEEAVSFFNRLGVEENARAEFHIHPETGPALSVRVNGAAYLDENGRRSGSMLVFTDISSLKQTQELLKKREEGYRTFIDQSAIGIWRIDYLQPVSISMSVDHQVDRLLESGIITECNDFMARLYGYQEAKDIIGKPLRDFYLSTSEPDNEKARSILRQYVLSGYRVSNSESKEHDRAGNVRYMLTNNIGIIENDRLIRTWGVQSDITERKNTERELREAYQELDTFFYKASHDLKGPIASMLGVVHLGQMDTADPQLSRYFNMIESSAQRLDRTLMELIELARTRKGASKVSAIGLRSFLDRILVELEHLPKFPKVRFDILVSDDVEVHTDRVLLQSVLKNLIHNSINYSSRTAPRIRISVKELATSIELEVSDNGEGIPEPVRPRIFDMFYRGHQESDGSGLGLFVVKNALEKMGGAIRFETSAGKGTSFYVTLPKILLES